MLVKIKRLVMIGETSYSAGIHDVPVRETESWFFRALVSDGDIEIVDPPASAAETQLQSKPVIKKARS